MRSKSAAPSGFGGGAVVVAVAASSPPPLSADVARVVEARALWPQPIELPRAEVVRVRRQARQLLFATIKPLEAPREPGGESGGRLGGRW